MEINYSGHEEIVRILAPLTDNPNAPNKDGKTPSECTKNEEIRRILESYKSSKKRAKKSGKSSSQRAKRTKKI